jgi:hypothetical protein
MSIHAENKLGAVPSEGCHRGTEMFWQVPWNVLVNSKKINVTVLELYVFH